MRPPEFSGAIDLSGLSTQTTVTAREAPVEPAFDIPPGAFACEVEGGCNLVIMGDGSDHTTQRDCVDTVLPYVEKYLQTREASIEVAEEYHKAVNVTRQVLAANQRLLEENDSLKAQLREARKGTPAAEKHVLAGAADLAASMKANFGTKEKCWCGAPELQGIHRQPPLNCSLAGEGGETTETVTRMLGLICDCCAKARASLPFHHDAHDDSGDSWDYCQECYDAGCSVNDPTGGCVL